MTDIMPMFFLPIPTACGGTGATTIRGVGDGILLGIIILGIMEVGIRITIIIGISDIITINRFMPV